VVFINSNIEPPPTRVVYRCSLFMTATRKPLRHKDLWKMRPAGFDVTPYVATTYAHTANPMPNNNRFRKEKIFME